MKLCFRLKLVHKTCRVRQMKNHLNMRRVLTIFVKKKAVFKIIEMSPFDSNLCARNYSKGALETLPVDWVSRVR